MNQDLKIRRLARNLARQTMHAGKPAANRIAAVLEQAATLPATRQRALLKHYHTYLAREMSHFEAIVEHAGPLSDLAQGQIAAELKSHYRHKIDLTLRENPGLIAGIKIRVADDVFDASALGRLNRLRNALQV